MRSDHRQWRIAKIRHFTCVPLSYANTRFAFIDAQRRDSVLLIRGISSYKTDEPRMILVHSINICTRHKGRVINRLAVYFGTNRKNPYIRLRKRIETIFFSHCYFTTTRFACQVLSVDLSTNNTESMFVSLLQPLGCNLGTLV